MTIRTQDELEQEWGLERFVRALSVLASWHVGLKHGHPFSEEEIMTLANSSRDALDLFSARTVYREGDDDNG